MNVLKKRFAPFLLVCVLALAMIAPAFAASNTSNYGTTIDGQYVAATIDVTVPTTGQVFINPYALPVKLSVMFTDGDATAADATESSTKVRPGSEASDSSIKNQQIVTEPLFIKNRSEVNLAVSAKVTGIIPADATENAIFGQTEASNVKFSSEPIKTQTDNSVFAYLQMKIAKGLTDQSTAGDLVAAYTNWTDDSYDKRADVLVSTKENSLDNMVILAAGTEKPATPGELEATNGSVAMFRIAGQVVTEPKNGWLSSDTFRIQVVFTFKPDPNRPTITANDDVTLEATTDSIVLTAELNGGDAEMTKVTWSIGGSTYVNDATTSNITGDMGETFTVKATNAAKGVGEQVVTITATIKADNGLIYTAEYKVTINIE